MAWPVIEFCAAGAMVNTNLAKTQDHALYTRMTLKRHVPSQAFLRPLAFCELAPRMVRCAAHWK